jgi:Putative Zn-dependent protease, contains TPR repeats
MDLKKALLGFVTGVSLFLTPQQTHGVLEIREGSIIRDSEIEAILRDITEPIFKVAGLDPKSLNLYVVATSDVNAAASLENSIFVNTGLILKSDNLEQLVGVLAHETGHLALGHVARFEESIRRSSLIAMASAALGIAALIAGSPEAGMGAMMAGQDLALHTLMHYSRGQEASADQAAVRFLRTLGWTPKGLQEFLNYLAKQELWSAARQDAYMRTHPLSSTRVQMLNSAVEKGPAGGQLPASLYQRYARMVIKIKAFLSPPMAILMQHPESKTGDLDRYARAIAYYRQNQLGQSLNELDILIQKAPHDPFLHELKGQIYFENGRLEESVKAYHTALTYAPLSPLIRLAYVQAKMQLPNASYPTALKELSAVAKQESKNPLVWHLMAIAYGKMGQKGELALALAEKALTLEDLDTAEQQANRALSLSTQQRNKLRARDILEFVRAEKKSQHL